MLESYGSVCGWKENEWKIIKRTMEYFKEICTRACIVAA